MKLTMINSSSLSVSPVLLVTVMFLVTEMPFHFSTLAFCSFEGVDMEVRVSSCHPPAMALDAALFVERDRWVELEILALMRP